MYDEMIILKYVKEYYLGHVQLPVQSLLQLVERGGNLLQQRVQPRALLNQHHEVRAVRIQQSLYVCMYVCMAKNVSATFTYVYTSPDMLIVMCERIM